MIDKFDDAVHDNSDMSEIIWLNIKLCLRNQRQKNEEELEEEEDIPIRAKTCLIPLPTPNFLKP